MTRIYGCENPLCIYWRDHCCILHYITLNARGSCNECRCVSLEERELKERRRRQIRELIKEDQSSRG